MREVHRSIKCSAISASYSCRINQALGSTVLKSNSPTRPGSKSLLNVSSISGFSGILSVRYSIKGPQHILVSGFCSACNGASYCDPCRHPIAIAHDEGAAVLTTSIPEMVSEMYIGAEERGTPLLNSEINHGSKFKSISQDATAVDNSITIDHLPRLRSLPNVSTTLSQLSRTTSTPRAGAPSQRGPPSSQPHANAGTPSHVKHPTSGPLSQSSSRKTATRVPWCIHWSYGLHVRVFCHWR